MYTVVRLLAFFRDTEVDSLESRKFLMMPCQEVEDWEDEIALPGWENGCSGIRPYGKKIYLNTVIPPKHCLGVSTLRHQYKWKTFLPLLQAQKMCSSLPCRIWPFIKEAQLSCLGRPTTTLPSTTLTRSDGLTSASPPSLTSLQMQKSKPTILLH